MQNTGNQSREQVIQCLDRAIQSGIYAKNNPIRNLDKEFRTHINFKDEKGNTLLLALLALKYLLMIQLSQMVKRGHNLHRKSYSIFQTK